ncbi:hypothetical protein DDB_G0281909 [Dictyostelium discoideum AX4]|uniref:Uncharacterized protein n=1 Tax=Dictyostelium discoideum TaxID=44689 RepID=Q54T96_DICDI|nr:hypothetical protein DDB_G0281909 [Dictyostelium discoideum AX4]EAL66514.1 hypothetical protein DDB_G0281909 [Dictyostelium discoideum AX4]|eukprot:XP_640493.1 hypothetical protein DDB_G0281909 [Dictyostelium discoideum AX4]
MTILSKVLVATGFLYGIYHVNNLVQEYKDYSLEQGYTLADFGFEQPTGLARPQKKKSARESNQVQQYTEEVQILSQRSKVFIDKGDYNSALPCLERIVEISQEYPPFASYGRNAILFIIKFSQEAGDYDLYSKYAKVLIESIDNPDKGELESIAKMVADFANRLLEADKSLNAIDIIKSSMERYSFPDKVKVDLILSLASLYRNTPNSSKKELKSILKAIKIAKSSTTPTLIINSLITLYEYYSKEGNFEKMRETVSSVEEHLDPKYSVSIYKYLAESAKSYEHYEDYYSLVDKLIGVLAKSEADPVNKENIVISVKLEKAETLMSTGSTEKAKEIYDQIKQNEYFCFATKSKSKYLSVEHVTSAKGLQSICVGQKLNTTLPSADTILVVDFENVEEKKEVEEEEKVEQVKVEQVKVEQVKVEQEEKEEEKKEEEEKVEEEKEKVEEEKVEEEKVEEEKVEEEKVEEEKVEEEEKEKVEEEKKEEEEVKVEEEPKQEEEKEEKVEEPKQEEEKVESEEVESEDEESTNVAKIIEISEDEKSIKVSELVVPTVNTITKPFTGESVTFENDSTKLSSHIGYLAKISLYDSTKTQLLDSLYQLIPPEKPKHSIK